MDQGPVVMPQIDAGARLVNEFDAYKAVCAPFWLKASDDREWSLYLVSDQIDDSNFDLAYEEVLRITGKIPDPWLYPFQVKVVGSDAPVAKDIIAIQQKYPGKMATRFHGRQLGGVTVEEAYIYPNPVPVAVRVPSAVLELEGNVSVRSRSCPSRPTLTQPASTPGPATREPDSPSVRYSTP